MTVTASDDFNRANASTLGSNYTVVSGGGQFAIVSNKASWLASWQDVNYNAADTGAADQYAKWTVTATGATHDHAAVMCRKASSTASDGYQAESPVYFGLGKLWILGKKVGGADFVLAESGTGASQTGTHTVEIRAVGSTISMHIDGVQVASEPDTTFDGTNRYTGFWCYQESNGPTFDDFEIGSVGALPAEGSATATWTVTGSASGTKPVTPVVEGVAETAVATAGTSHAITLPASIASTDLVMLLVDIGSTGATFNALTGWTEVLDESVANGLKVLIYTGAGVPSAPTFTSSAATRSATLALRISGADKTITPQIGTTATGTSLTPDPPSVTPTGGTVKAYLFVAFAGMAGEEADDDTWANTPPTNYLPSPPWQKACGTAGTNLGGLIMGAYRIARTGAAEDPGTFNVDVSAAWRAQTVIVHPTSAGGTGSATATWAVTGSAAGARASRGTATAAWAVTPAATGKRVPKGAAAATWTVTSSATGSNAAAPRSGSAAAVWTVTPLAAGARASRGSTTLSWTVTSSATGARASRGSSSSSWTVTSSATGKRTPKAAAAAAWTVTGSATGKRTPKATATATWTVTGSATGVAPVPGVNQGTALATWTVTATATGARASRGTAAAVTWTVTSSASGVTPELEVHDGAAVVSWSVTATAAGDRPSAGASAAAVTWTVTAFGSTTELVALGLLAGIGEFVDWQWGAEPIVDFFVG